MISSKFKSVLAWLMFIIGLLLVAGGITILVIATLTKSDNTAIYFLIPGGVLTALGAINFYRHT